MLKKRGKKMIVNGFKRLRKIPLLAGNLASSEAF